MERVAFHPDGRSVFADWDDDESVTIYDHRKRKPIATLKMASAGFAVVTRWDSGRLYTSEGGTPEIREWDLSTGKQTGQIDLPHPAGAFEIDSTGKRVCYLARKGFHLVATDTGQQISIENCKEDLDFGTYSPKLDQFLLPMRRKGRLMRIDFRKVAATEIELPFDVSFRWVEFHPGQKTYSLIDTKKQMHSVDAKTDRVLWTSSLRKVIGKDHVGVGGHTGDGRFITGAIARRSSNACVVVSAKDGSIVACHEDCDDSYGFPFRDESILSRYVSDSGFDEFTLLDVLKGDCDEVLVKFK
jgi:hypothetical protein